MPATINYARRTETDFCPRRIFLIHEPRRKYYFSRGEGPAKRGWDRGGSRPISHEHKARTMRASEFLERVRCACYVIRDLPSGTRYDMFNSRITGPACPAASPFLSFSLSVLPASAAPFRAVINGSVVERSPPSVRTGDGTDTISYFIYLHATRRTGSPDSAPPTRIYEVWRGKRSFPLRSAPSVSVRSSR